MPRVGDPASSFDLAYTHDAGGNRLSTIDEVNHVETVYHYDVEDEPEYVYDSFNNRLMYFETFDTSGAEAELVSTTYYFYNDYGNVTRKVTELADPEPGEKRYRSTYLKYATNGHAVTYLVGEEWTYPESDYAVTFAREFWYDGARQRFLNRELDPVALTDGIVDVESETWSDYVGDSIYADFTFDGSTVTVPRIYEPGMGKVDGLSVGGAAYYHADHIGTTRLLSGYNGSADDESVYSAFGGLVSGTNHRYGYAGKHGYQSHADTPFLHVGARYYDPATGRFLQRDPIGIDGGLNVYVYALNNPALQVDPSGLHWAIDGQPQHHLPDIDGHGITPPPAPSVRPPQPLVPTPVPYADDCVMTCVRIYLTPLLYCKPASFGQIGRHEDNQDNCEDLGGTWGFYSDEDPTFTWIGHKLIRRRGRPSRGGV